MPSEATGNPLRITKIAATKKDRIYVYFGDEKFAMPKDAFTDFYLYVGKVLTPSEFEEIKKYVQNQDLYEYGRNLMTHGSYSEFLLMEKLKKRDSVHAKAVLERLKKDGFVDDVRYASDYFEAKTMQGYGRLKITNELVHVKRVSSGIVESLPWSETSNKALDLVPYLETRFRSYPLKAKKDKARSLLERRGFSKREIDEALSHLSTPLDSDITPRFEKDFLSCVKRYGKSYNGFEMKKRVMAALLRRGYSYEAIEKRLEEMNDEQSD